MGSSIRTPDKKILMFLIMLPVFCLNIFSCSAKIPDNDEFKSIWNVMEAKMPRWIEFSRKRDPGFDISNFYLEKSAALKPITEDSFTVYRSKELESIYSKYYYNYSPDSSKYLDIYSDTAELSIENDTIKAWFQGDAAAILIDLKNCKKSVFISCGTACGCDEAVWIDNDSFIVTGAITAHTPPYPFHTFIHYINLKEKIHKIYLSTRPLPRGSGGYYGIKFPKFVQ
ncbi:MAG TPA: hypothetical protein VHO03_13055 [Ignavibacteriales bacterium]|nr:hypothetical protein [Ignavibacteriales bacterium]